MSEPTLPSTPRGSHMVAQGRFDPGSELKMSSRPLAGRTEPGQTLCDPQGVGFAGYANPGSSPMRLDPGLPCATHEGSRHQSPGARP